MSHASEDEPKGSAASGPEERQSGAARRGRSTPGGHAARFWSMGKDKGAKGKKTPPHDAVRKRTLARMEEGQAIQLVNELRTIGKLDKDKNCLLYTSPSPRDRG